LSGDIGTAGDNSDNCYHVVTGSGVDGTSILDGLTITGGNANGTAPNNRGGGMYNSAGSPTLANVTFSGNTALHGGGMYNYNSSPRLAHVIFSGNTADFNGGGMFNTVSSSPMLSDVTFSGNSSQSDGGMSNDISSPTLENVIFIGNSAEQVGGGMGNNYNSGPTTLNNVTFIGNTASYGSGMYNASSNPTLANVTFSGNTATYDGGGMFNYNGSNPTLANTIVWGNTPATNQISNEYSTPFVTYSDVQGGYAGAGNINADPQFVRSPSPGGDGTWGTSDDDYGDLRLQLASPAIDAGDNAAVPFGVLTDLLGFPRFVDIASVPDMGSGTPPIVDMGAYEAQLVVYLPVLQK
jgi:hypothetical protein